MKKVLIQKLREGFDRCKKIIIEGAAKGWRLKQIVIPANEKQE